MMRAAAALLLCVGVAVRAQAEVPSCIHVQGVLTDTAGAPLSPGLKIFTFRIFDADSAGSQIWPASGGEDQTLTSSAEGLWNACVGSEIPLSEDLFVEVPRWLEIAVTDGLSPVETLGRLELHTSPFAFRAVKSEQADGLSPAGLAQIGGEFVRTTGDTLSGPLALDFAGDGNNDFEIRDASGPAANLALFDDDTLKAFIWGQDYGELDLYDGNGSLGAALVAASGGGGQLFLYKENGAAGVQLNGGTTTDGATLAMRNAAGTVTLSADADLTGSSALVLPSNAVSSFEVLDEPGVAYVASPGEVTLSGSISTLASRTMVAPASGYVLVIATMFFRVIHTTGNSTIIFYDAPNVTGTFLDADWLLWESGLPTGTRIITQTIHRLYPVAAGSHTYYVTARVSSGAAVIGDVRLTALFIPTAYGTVAASAVSSMPGDSAAGPGRPLDSRDLALEKAASEASDLDRLERELLELNKDRAELELRLEAVEAAVLGDAQPRRASEAPRR